MAGSRRESSQETGSEPAQKRVRCADPTFICSCLHRCIKPTLLKLSTWYYHRKWREADEAKVQAKGESTASSSYIPQEASRSCKLTWRSHKNKQKAHQIEKEPESDDEPEQSFVDNSGAVPYDEIDIPGLVDTFILQKHELLTCMFCNRTTESLGSLIATALSVQHRTPREAHL